MNNLSVVYATRNEELHIGGSIEAIKDIADEIIVFDEYSKDKTVNIAQSLGAKTFLEHHHNIFHITKQKAIDKASSEWILQLDADEIVTPLLAHEIKKIIGLSDDEVQKYENELVERDLFVKHQKLLNKRDGKVGTENGSYVAFFIPRRNLFLGKYLKYGGNYPDGVIRLFKKGKAFLPCKDVHEQMKVNGRVGWLSNYLEHIPDADFKRYLRRNSNYIDLLVKEIKKQNVKKSFVNFIKYTFFLPFWWFLLTLIRHKGIFDGWQGVVFSFFSALRFPRAYLRYIKSKKGLKEI